MAHAHPDFSKGGGEIAAYNLFNAYRNAPGVEHTWFLGRVDRGRGASGRIGTRRADEYVWEQGIGDWHQMKAANCYSTLTAFRELIEALRPTVVHAHHYVHLGLEFLQVIKQVDPSIRIVMTLHEYMAICRNNGQMIKTNQGGQLCSRESFDDCHQCFPKHSAEDFWLRKHAFMSHFDLIDQFVSPSEFLKSRYVEWGIDANRISVIENGQDDLKPLPPRAISPGERRNRFGYFGQINPYKGLHVVLEALIQLPPESRAQIRFEVHGANLEVQEQAFQEKIHDLRVALEAEGVLQWIGPYEPSQLRERMAGIDWVVIPSIWWENSPMVIQEAFLCGRPVVASNIGGMAEKVGDSINGLHVPVGSRHEWGQMLVRAATDADLWPRLRDAIHRPANHQQCAQAHLRVF